MSPEIICTLISVTGVVLSGVISVISSRIIANNELKKLERSWAREDSATSDEEIEQLAAAIYDFVTCGNDNFRLPAISKLAAIRAKETSDLAPLLDQLHDALYRCNRSQSEQLFSEVIKHKREQHRTQQNPKAIKPKKK